MFREYFYHGSLRKVNAVFGSLFNNITIKRKDSDGLVAKEFVVPIDESQKRGFLVRKNEMAKREGAPNIGITLPRIAYEFVGMSYRAGDQLSPSRVVRTKNTTNTNDAKKMYNAVPYDVAMDLSIFAINVDDALQILEQILPLFAPHFSVTINEVATVGVKNDLLIRLDGFDTNIDYEGHIEEGRLIVWTLNFTVSTWLFHKVTDAAIIKKTIENMYGSADETKLDAKLEQVVNPFTADEDDAHTIDETITEY